MPNDGDLRVSWEDIGEGWMGDFDPDDPTDVPLLRFTVEQFHTGEGWDYLTDGSYCTQAPVGTAQAVLDQQSARILTAVKDGLTSGRGYKRALEEMSWFDGTFDD